MSNAKRQISKILVTGGAGFIGSAVIRNTEDSVVNVDKRTYAGNLECLAETRQSPRYAFEQVDICDCAELDRIFAHHQPDAVMHLAAESHVDRSIDGPVVFTQTNLVLCCCFRRGWKIPVWECPCRRIGARWLLIYKPFKPGSRSRGSVTAHATTICR